MRSTRIERITFRKPVLESDALPLRQPLQGSMGSIIASWELYNPPFWLSSWWGLRRFALDYRGAYVI